MLKNSFTYKIFLTTIFCCCGFVVFAQLPPAVETQARAELERRGLSETDLRAKLLGKGINVDNIQPEQLPMLQPAIEAAVQELEQEKKQKEKPATVDNAVPSGATTPAAPAAPIVAVPVVIESAPVAPATKAPVYGQQIFREKAIGVFNVTKDARPPDSYVLGVGDEITVTIFGPSQEDVRYTINNEGYISPAKMPKIFLKGLTYEKGRELLRNRFSQFYLFRSDQFSASITTVRNVNVNIFGEVVNYGSFALPAMNTAFTALVAAGGPTDLGSVRNIKVQRNRETKILDVYTFMNNPAVQFDFYLQENDIIHIPVAERVVGIEGAVKRPLRYELIATENLRKLIEFAGGFSDDAYRSQLQVRRYIADREVLLDVDWAALQKQNGDFTLQPGDVVVVKRIPRTADNFATIEGAVDLPGQYALENTPRISDLLDKSKLKIEARRDAAFLLRTNPDETLRLLTVDLNAVLASPQAATNIALQPKDKLIVYAQERFADQFKVTISGAVREPSTLTFANSQRLNDLINQVGGLTEDAIDFGYLIRKDPANPARSNYQRVNVRKALDNPTGADNVNILPDDQLQVLSKSTFTDMATVKVVGAVRNPGEFKYSPTLNLQDALTLAGGLRLEGSGTRIDVFRILTNDNQPTRTLAATVAIDKATLQPTNGEFVLLPYDQIVVRQIPNFDLQKIVTLEGEVQYPGPYSLLSDNESLTSLIERAGGLTVEAFAEGATLYRGEENLGYVVTRLDKAMQAPDSRYNIVLHEGDVITIPKTKDLVTIRVANTKASEYYADRLVKTGRISVAYVPGKNARWYVERYAAGLDKNARWRYLTVEDPNGHIRGVRSAFDLAFPRPRKGSVISVGAKQVKTKEQKERKPLDWDKVLAQILAVATAAALILTATR